MRAALIAILSTVAIAPLAIAPAASAQTTCEQRSDRTAATVGGAAIGAILGGSVAGKDDRVGGAALGGVAGALIGNQLGKSKAPNYCNQAYGYYDNNGAWHTASVDRSRAAGYYDRNGNWVTGLPNGYYDNRGAWVVADANMRQGYYDDNDHWVPPSVNGYYDSNNRWIAVVDRRDDWNDRPTDARSRADWLRQRIVRAENRGDLSHRDARRFLNELQDISVREARMPHRNGGLNYRDEQVIQAQLDNLSADVREEMRG
jgi:hypothetical protein